MIVSLLPEALRIAAAALYLDAFWPKLRPILGGTVASGAARFASCLDPERGAGVGTALLDAIKAAGRAAGCVAPRLDVVDTNPRARALYERRGFRAVHTERMAWLRPILGFSASTHMTKTLEATP